MSAVDFTNAADALDREVRRLENFSAAAKKFRELGSLEQACEESQRRLDGLHAFESEMQERVAKLEVGHADILEKSARVKEAHKATLIQMDEAVDRRAKEITEAATEQAKQIVGDAKMNAEAAIKSSREHADAIAKDAVDMKAAVEVAKAAHADLLAQHDELIGRIEQARAAAATILGAA